MARGVLSLTPLPRHQGGRTPARPLETTRLPTRLPCLRARREGRLWSLPVTKQPAVDHKAAPRWRVLVVGAGAIGQLFGALLARAGHRVVFGARRLETKRALKTKGLRVRGVESFELAPTDYRVRRPDEGRVEADAALFCVKSYDLSEALQDWIPRLPEGIPLLFLQNGAGFWEEVRREGARFFPYACVTTSGANLQKEAVHFAGKGTCSLFPLSAPFPKEGELLALFGEAGLCPRREADLTFLWQKLQLNAGINPLATLLCVRNGYLTQEPHARELARLVFTEAGKLLGLAADVAQLEQVLEGTRANINSMLQDARAGRPLEIEAISGYLLRRAAEQKAAGAYNDFLYHLLKARYGD